MPDKTTGIMYMDIQEIKAKISAEQNFPLGTLNMVRQFNEQKEPTKWVSHWDNDHRVRVSMHEEIMGQLRADPKKNDLGLKREIVAATEERASYVRYIVITPKHIEAAF
jgi:hypothetical protein